MCVLTCVHRHARVGVYSAHAWSCAEMRMHFHFRAGARACTFVFDVRASAFSMPQSDGPLGIPSDGAINSFEKAHPRELHQKVFVPGHVHINVCRFHNSRPKVV